MADERDPALRRDVARVRLGDVVEQRPETERLAARELVRQRLVEHGGDGRRARTERRRRIPRERDRRREHRARVTVERRGGGNGSARRREGRPAPAAPPRSTPRSSISSSPSSASLRADDPLELREDPLGRDVAQRRRADARGGRRRRCVDAEARARHASRASRSDPQRVRGEHPARDHAQPAHAKVLEPGERVDVTASAESGRAIALTSGRACAGRPRSSLRVSGSRSTCQLWSRATTRQPPNASDSANAWPLGRLAPARAASGRGSPCDRRRRSRSSGARAAGRGRAPPTSHAVLRDPAQRQPADRSRHRLPVAVIRARHPARDPAQNLVVDRSDPHAQGPRPSGARAPSAPMISAAGARPRRRRLGSEVDGHVVHADSADQRVAPRPDQDARSCW